MRHPPNNAISAGRVHIVEPVHDAHSSKPLLLAAIGALSCIRPAEARNILEDLAEADDEEIADAVSEAMAAIEGHTGDGGDEEDEWVNWAACSREFGTCAEVRD